MSRESQRRRRLHKHRYVGLLVVAVALAFGCMGMTCVEATPSDCATDADCDDGVFCNGAEQCSLARGLRLCFKSDSPCSDEISAGGSCDEENDVCIPASSNNCNQPCGFDDAAPDGQRAAAVCNITSPDDVPFAGSPTDGIECASDADCDDGNPCTVNSCIGAVVKICEGASVADCVESTTTLSNGQTLLITLDRVVLSATVNQSPTSIESKELSWVAEGLTSGTQTLLIEWENRAGAMPQMGCHEVEISVP